MCCAAAWRDAVIGRCEHFGCKIHRVDAVLAVVPVASVTGTGNTPNLVIDPQLLKEPLQVLHPGQQPQEGHHPLPVTALNTSVRNTIILVPAPSTPGHSRITSVPSTPARNQITAVLAQTPSQRLAQLIGPLWWEKHQQAVSECENILSLKRCNEEMQSLSKRLIHFVIWHTVCTLGLLCCEV
jgi:hypothetical protein